MRHKFNSRNRKLASSASSIFECFGLVVPAKRAPFRLKEQPQLRNLDPAGCETGTLLKAYYNVLHVTLTVQQIPHSKTQTPAEKIFWCCARETTTNDGEQPKESRYIEYRWARLIV
jgi:hypothetical protein